ncbi:MAG: twin-arginine translocase subunit TatC [Bacteroidia bacterium]|nr:twin-arginine translocase subunit TatC [Bacteroidia bacterium]
MGLFSWRKSEKDPEKEMSFLDHLEELRWHLFRGAIFTGAIAIALFVVRKWVMTNVFFWPLQDDFITNQYLCQLTDEFCNSDVAVKMQVLSPYEQFMKAMVYSFFGGVILGFPFLVWELWRFIKPGLTEGERKAARWNVLSMSTLFFSGVLFGYFIIMPFSIKFFTSFELVEGIENNWRIGDYISFVMLLMGGTGALFQLPILIYYLTRLGFVTPQFLKKYRRHAVVVILFISALLTPPDPLSQIVVFIPLFMLYEVGIWISSRVVERRRKEALKEATA